MSDPDWFYYTQKLEHIILLVVKMAVYGESKRAFWWVLRLDSIYLGHCELIIAARDHAGQSVPRYMALYQVHRKR
jgi:hypothetical protein